MKIDFTHEVYRTLLMTLVKNFQFSTISMHSSKLNRHVIALRHDVDRRPRTALEMAEVEAGLGIQSTYYFRTKRFSFDPDVISRISVLGHEIGFHYESLSDTNGNLPNAWDDFRRQLAKFEFVGEVSTISMHGRPFSKWDSRMLWEEYDYRELGITSEAYLDVDWNRFVYLNDTGREWLDRYNIRDRIPNAPDNPVGLERGDTFELISKLQAYRGDLVISAHPERWASTLQEWTVSLMSDKAINMAKSLKMMLQ